MAYTGVRVSGDRMKIADKIYIHQEKEPVSGDIFSHLTYENPDYYQKMNLGLYVGNIPKEIRTYTMRGNVLEIMRGEALKIKPYIKNFTYEFHHPDHPISLRYINNDFDLDEYQEAAVQAIKGKRQGIIHAVTSAGKSLIILKAIVEIGQRAVIVVHRKILMEQLLKDIKKYIRDEKGNEIKPGIIGSGSVSLGDITVAIDKTLSRNLPAFREQFGVAILDECHIAPAQTISDLINSINARNRYGFSGTLKRKDQKEFLIHSTFGEVIYKIGKEELLEKGRVVPVKVGIITTDTQFNWDDAVQGFIDQEHKNPTQAARHLQEKTIRLNPARNEQILRYVAQLKGKTIVLCRYVEPCYTLQEGLRTRYGLESGIITGRDGKEGSKSYLAMKDSDLQIVFATIGCIAEGVSVSDLEHIVLISPLYNNELLLHQIRGRLMRTFEGKTHGTLHFFYDQYIFHGGLLKKFLRLIHS